MAYAAVLTLSKAIDQILPRHQDEYLFLCDKHQMQSLYDKIICLREFLEAFPVETTTVSQIRDVAHQVEDIIESITTGSIDQSRGLYWSWDSYFDHIAKEFGSCMERVDIILKQAEMMKNILHNKDTHSRTTKGGSAWMREPRAKHALKSGEAMEMKKALDREDIIEASSAKDTNVGLDEDMIQMLDRITGKGAMLQIVPITGMGGIGKTTLARAVYEHPRTLHHFDVRLWVTVSQEYSVREILRALLPVLEPDMLDETLTELVHKRLTARRFLIVLDDMWDEKVWDRVRIAFPDDNRGSRVIITTRLLRVAAYVGTSSHMHEMQLLNEDQSWDLFRKKVYCPDAEFEDIGRTISRNCKGLPLAVAVTAGLLKFNNSKDYWEEVARNSYAEGGTNHADHIFGVLSLSYTNLPVHLKPCFLYMGAFREDCEIPTKELVSLWTADGFLQPRESKTMEEVAEEYLEELVERSLVLVANKRSNRKIKTTRVHDLLRDLSLRKAHEEFFFHSFKKEDRDCSSELLRGCRRLTMDSNFTYAPLFFHEPHVRSFLDKSTISYGWNEIIPQFKLLRVLARVHLRDMSFLSVVFMLTNLRYLHLYVVLVDLPVSVPESIYKLQNLETLIFSHEYPKMLSKPHFYILVLPLQLWKLPRLRHCVSLPKTRLPFPVFSLSHFSLEALQTLSGVTNFNLTRSVVKKIPNLRKLKLDYCNITGAEDDDDHAQPFLLDNLVHLHQLEELSVVCNFEDSYEGPRPTKLICPRKLRKLSLKGTLIPWHQMKSFPLPNLEVLKLKQESFIGEDWEPIEGQFLRLKYLKMKRLNIKEWRAESIHYPSLEELIITSCENLEEVPASIGEIESLQKLTLKNCKSAEESVENIKEEQESFDNDLLQVTIMCVSDDED